MAGDKIKYKGGTVVDSDLHLYQAGVEITASAAEINAGVTGLTATSAELNRVADTSTRVTTTTATVLALTATQHSEGVVIVNTDHTQDTTITLPAAAGTGNKYTVINNVDQTQSNVVVAALGTNIMDGVCYLVSSDVTNYAQAFATSATSDKITLTGSTNAQVTGGFGGDRIECIDISATTWLVTCWNVGSGTLATPFAASS